MFGSIQKRQWAVTPGLEPFHKRERGQKKEARVAGIYGNRTVEKMSDLGFY